SGVDLQVDWTFDLVDAGLPEWGTLKTNLIVGWLDTWERQDASGGPFNGRTGTIDSSAGYTFPEWKFLGSAMYQRDAYSVGLRWRYFGEVDIYNTAYKLEAVFYFDLFGTWDLNDSFVVRAGVNNLTDREPRSW